MLREETGLICKRIKAHFESFDYDDFKLKQWHEILKEYDYQDVNERLTRHIESEDFGDKIPKMNFLIKGLTKSKEKGLKPKYVVYCPLCNETLNYDFFDKHYKRCSSVSYILKKSNEIFKQQLDRKKLMDLPDKKFDELYTRFLNKIAGDGTNSPVENKLLTAILYPNESKELLNEVIKSFTN